MSGGARLRLTVVAGRADVAAADLEPGVPVGPVTLGRRAEWRIESRTTAPMHAYLQWDGERLFVSNIDRRAPTTVDGALAGNDWTLVPPGARIALGEAEIVVSVVDESDAASFAPYEREEPDDDEIRADELELFDPPKPLPSRVEPARPTFADRPEIAPHRDDEATALHPIGVGPTGPVKEAAPAVIQPKVAVAASALTPAPAARVSGEAPEIAPAGAGPAPVAPATPAPNGASWPPIGAVAAGARPAETAKVGALRAAFAEASWVQKAIVALMPFALVATWVLFDDEPARPRAAKRRTGEVAAATSGRAAAQASAPASASAPVVAPSAPAPSAAVAAARDGRSAERAAADAVAAGAWAEAARRYEDLAAAHPDAPVYREGARILRAKAGAAP